MYIHTNITLLSNRRLDNKFNIFEGITHNWFFIGINLIMIGGQVMIIFVGGKAFHVRPLNGAQWGYSVVLGALSLPVAVLIRVIPDEWCAHLIPVRKWRRRLAPDTHGKEGLVRRGSDLTFIKKIRGGRVSSLKFRFDEKKDHVMEHMHLHHHARREGGSAGSSL